MSAEMALIFVCNTVQHFFTVFQWVTRHDDGSMQHGRNTKSVWKKVDPTAPMNREERRGWKLLASLPEQNSSLDDLTDAQLKEHLGLITSLGAALGYRTRNKVPLAVAVRILADVLDKCRRSATAQHKPQLDKTYRLLHSVRARMPIKKPPRNRPRKNWYQLQDEMHALNAMICRQPFFEDLGQSPEDALRSAAACVAPRYHVSAETLLSWFANPGRRRNRRK